jgi:hypothetical protein
MPRKVFVAGEILTAADVNANLMDQAVQVFDDATDRTTQLPSPTEGMVTYLKSDDQVTVFDGSAYKPVGGLVAVKSVLKTDTFSASVTSGNNVAVTDLSITHEVQDPANKLIISAFFGTLGDSGQLGLAGLALHDGSGLIAVGDAAGNRTRMTAGARTSASAFSQASVMPHVSVVHTPGAGSKTYTVRAVNFNTGTQTLFVNRNDGDTDAVFNQRSVSSLIIQEVAV